MLARLTALASLGPRSRDMNLNHDERLRLGWRVEDEDCKIEVCQYKGSTLRVRHVLNALDSRIVNLGYVDGAYVGRNDNFQELAVKLFDTVDDRLP
jgi:hypothetical protein